MAITVPGNPFGVDVAVSSPGGIGGLQEAPATENGIGNAITGMTESFSKFGQAVENWQKEIDATRVQDASNQLNSAMLDLKYNKDTGWQQQKGKNALERPSGKSLFEETQESFKKSYDSIRATLGTARQRAAFDELYKGMSAQLGNEVNVWTTRQQIVYQDDVDRQTLESAIAQGMSTDPTTRASGMAAAKAMIDKIYSRQGLDPDYSKGPGLVAAMSVEQLVDNGSASQARAYLEENRKYMSPTQIAKAERLIQKGLESEQVEATVRSILLANPDDEVAAKKALAGVPSKIRGRVRTSVSRYFSDLEDEKQAQTKAAREAVWGYINENNRLPPPSLLDDLPEKEQYQIRQKFDENGPIIKKSSSSGPSLSTIRKDPINYALTTGEYGLTPIDGWQDLPKAYGELSVRADRLESMKESYKLLEPKLLTSDELFSLKATLEAQDTNAQVQTLSGIAKGLPLQAVKVLADQLGDDWGNLVMLSADDDMRLHDVPRLYLTGRQGLKENQPSLKLLRDQTTGINGIAQTLNGLYSNGQVRDRVLDTVLNVAAGLAMERGEAGGRSHLEEALETVVGKVVDYRGSKIALKGEATPTDVKKAIREVRDAYRGKTEDAARTASGVVFEGDALSKLISRSQLVPSGEDNQFLVVYGDQFLLRMDGEPFLIELQGGD